MSSRSQEREHSTSVVFLEESNEACALLLVLIPLALSTAVMRFGPYLDLSSRLAPDKPLDEAPVASTTEAAVLFERLGEAGRLFYRRHSWWDVCVVVAHAATLTIVQSVALPCGRPPRFSQQVASISRQVPSGRQQACVPPQVEFGPLGVPPWLTQQVASISEHVPSSKQQAWMPPQVESGPLGVPPALVQH